MITNTFYFILFYCKNIVFLSLRAEFSFTSDVPTSKFVATITDDISICKRVLYVERLNFRNKLLNLVFTRRSLIINIYQESFQKWFNTCVSSMFFVDSLHRDWDLKHMMGSVFVWPLCKMCIPWVVKALHFCFHIIGTSKPALLYREWPKFLTLKL